MAEHLDRGTFGEQGAGFFLGPRGYFLVEGPSGTQGHAANASGFDGVAYSVARDDLIVYDNKTLASSRNVAKGTAIDPAVNLAKNLDALIGRVQSMTDLPSRYRILDLLRQLRTSVTKTGASPPPNVRIAITNFGGNSPGITKALAGRGVSFIDMNSAPAVPAGSSRIYLSKQTIPSMAQPAGSGGAGAHNARGARVGAAAEATRYVAQGLNDWSLKVAVNRELERLAGPIAEAIVRGGGALVVINISVTSPPGNVGMVQARSISSAYVMPYHNRSGQEAVKVWEMQPKLEQVRGAHARLETFLLWIAAPEVR